MCRGKLDEDCGVHPDQANLKQKEQIVQSTRNGVAIHQVTAGQILKQRKTDHRDRASSPVSSI